MIFIAPDVHKALRLEALSREMPVYVVAYILLKKEAPNEVLHARLFKGLESKKTLKVDLSRDLQRMCIEKDLSYTALVDVRLRAALGL